MKIEFKEEQKFTQWWLWLILIGVELFQMYGLFNQLILGEKFGTKPMSDLGLIIFAMIPLGIIILVWLTKLETKIDQNEIRIKFIPFIKKTFKWEDVQSAEVLKYGFVGYGIRLFTKYGTVYNIKGNRGLAIELKNGKKLLIGTQKEVELTQIVEKYLKR